MPDKKIISISLQKIMPNPHQPRRSFREGSIQEMADSLKASGQQTPLKVCPLTEAEKIDNAPFEVMVLGRPPAPGRGPIGRAGGFGLHRTGHHP